MTLPQPIVALLRTLLILTAAMLFTPVIAQTCFESARVAGKVTAERLQTTCRTDLKLNINKSAAETEITNAAKGMGVQCFASCKPNENSTACVDRFADNIAIGFFQNLDLRAACEKFKQ